MTQKQTIEANNENQTQSSHKNRVVCSRNMVMKVFTETIEYIKGREQYGFERLMKKKLKNYDWLFAS